MVDKFIGVEFEFTMEQVQGLSLVELVDMYSATKAAERVLHSEIERRSQPVKPKRQRRTKAQMAAAQTETSEVPSHPPAGKPTRRSRSPKADKQPFRPRKQRSRVQPEAPSTPVDSLPEPEGTSPVGESIY